MSSRSTAPWHTYQRRVADFLGQAGWTVQMDAQANGVRGKRGYQVDIWATLDVGGFEHRRVVECKLWNRKVTGKEVRNLLQIVEDVGAHGGLLFAESGFYPSAVEAADKTSVQLAALAELHRAADDHGVIGARVEFRAPHRNILLVRLFGAFSVSVDGGNFETVELRAILLRTRITMTAGAF